MYFVVKSNTLPLTIEDNPLVKQIKLTLGVISFIDIGFSQRNARLCQARVFYNTLQLIPWNRDEWITGNNETIRIPVELEVNDEPYLFTLHTFNKDDTFSHEVTFGLSLTVGTIVGLPGLAALNQILQVRTGDT